MAPGGQQVYRIQPGTEDAVQLRFLDGMNALRQAAGAPPVAFNASLNAAAATHARDMSVQNRPWHFGSDGSSPLDRVRRVGYGGRLLGENISETFETELETLAAWMETPETRTIITDPQATDLGFSWFQEASGKIWWTMVTGNRSAAAINNAATAAVAPPAGR
ncbi:Cysteine-rich secretory protein family protein [Rhodobacteraceae bacterium THAF1]|nr:Cysteine-rich secretory protein family protein [Palleronia sp. THAF1]VDC16851.1 Cysteine-rich secretory protein family protein [Rhodobacteraceae bacterium THAF1]